MCITRDFSQAVQLFQPDILPNAINDSQPGSKRELDPGFLS